jgi:cell division protein FtsA
MDSTDKQIVSIDLGSSKFALTVAKVNGFDVQVIYYRETAAAGMKYSAVMNVRQASEVLARLISEAENELGIKITQAVVGMPKFFVRQESSRAELPDREEDAEITAEDISFLKSLAEEAYPLKDSGKESIFGAVAQSFSDGENFQIIENDIVGMTSDVLEGYFKIFIGKLNDLKKINLVLERAGIIPVQKFFTADTTAKAVLYESEMENGVALVDIGAGSTSVSIYEGNVMRHYASIPFGGKNITDDIKNEAEITERLAENIKLAYGACMPEKLLNLSEKVLHIRSNNGEGDKTLPVKYLSEIITARVEEIIMAILYEIERSGYADMLRSGIVITGGTAQILNICNFIHDISGYKVRTGYPKQIFSYSGCAGVSDTSAATSIGLIQAAKYGINCAIVQDIEEDETEIEETEIKVEETVETETVTETISEVNEEQEEDNKNRDLFGNEVKEPRTGRKPIWTLLGDLFNEMEDNNV